MNPVRLAVLSLSAISFVVGFVLFSTSERRGAPPETPPVGAGTDDAVPIRAAEPAVRIRALTVETAVEPVLVEVAGVVEPIRSVVVAAEVEGRVIEVLAEEHAPVSAGDVLVRIDPVLLRAAAHRAEAEVERERAAHQLAELELAREQGLARRKVTSDAALERSESKARSSEAAVLVARAALEDARARLERSEVRAPFGGYIQRLDLDLGAYVRPGSDVAELIDLSTVEVRIEVTDREVVVLRTGDPVTVEVAVHSGEKFRGIIAAVGHAADSRVHKYPVTVRVSNAQERLLPGMIATVRLTLPASETLRIPRGAIRREFELEYVFTLEPDSNGWARAHRRRVVTRSVPFAPSVVEVISGLRDGERIAISGARELSDGLRVYVGLREPS